MVTMQSHPNTLASPMQYWKVTKCHLPDRMWAINKWVSGGGSRDSMLARPRLIQGSAFSWTSSITVVEHPQRIPTWSADVYSACINRRQRQPTDWGGSIRGWQNVTGTAMRQMKVVLIRIHGMREIEGYCERSHQLCLVPTRPHPHSSTVFNCSTMP